MEQPLVEEFGATTARLTIKFGRTLEVSTITNEKFKVYNADTDTEIVNPFRTIDLTQDYNSISRILTLHWSSGKLAANTTYNLVITGFEDIAGNDIPDSTNTFITDDDLSDDPIVDPTPTVTPVVIEDFSVIPDSTITTEVITSGNAFRVTDTDPRNGEYYLEPDYKNGRITVKFSLDPQAQYINPSYFKMQSKPMQRGPVRWSSVPVHVSKNSNRPWVYVDMPSTDDTPVYTTVGKEYFKENTRYRLIISSEVSSA